MAKSVKPLSDVKLNPDYAVKIKNYTLSLQSSGIH